jgi:hypothetical protein
MNIPAIYHNVFFTRIVYYSHDNCDKQILHFFKICLIKDKIYLFTNIPGINNSYLLAMFNLRILDFSKPHTF